MSETGCTHSWDQLVGRETARLRAELEAHRKRADRAESRYGHIRKENRRLRTELFGALGLLKSKLMWWDALPHPLAPEVESE